MMQSHWRKRERALTKITWVFCVVMLTAVISTFLIAGPGWGFFASAAVLALSLSAMPFDELRADMRRWADEDEI